MSKHQINKIIYAAFLVRFVGVIIRSFGDIVQPHVWRQIDTLGISFRYWLRLVHEPLSSTFLLPAALQSSDGNGILPVEFPFLNFVFFPFWAAGPYWGKVVIYILLATLIFGICKKLSDSRVWMSTGFLLLPFTSYSADYIEKFIPDTLATLLVGLGCVSLIRNRKIAALALITLGLLIKPTAVVALALLLAFSRFRKLFWRYAIQLAIPLCICITYYTFGLKFIDHFRSGEVNFFFVQPRSPLTSLMEVLSNMGFILNEFTNRVFFAFGIIFIAVGTALSHRRFRSLIFILFGLLVLQFFTIAALDGGHSAQHDYYYMGMSLVSVTLTILIIRKSVPWFSTLFAIVLFFHAVELSLQNMNPNKLKGFYSNVASCMKLKSDTPELPWNQGYVFRSNEEPFPALGLCFGERESSKISGFGFFYADKPIPEKCIEIARETTYLVAKCSP